MDEIFERLQKVERESDFRMVEGMIDHWIADSILRKERM
jgi:hypothetical protein